MNCGKIEDKQIQNYCYCNVGERYPNDGNRDAHKTSICHLFNDRKEIVSDDEDKNETICLGHKVSLGEKLE